MAKKGKNNDKESTVENYYDLKIKEMDELVAALKDNSPREEDKKLSLDVEECTGEKIAEEDKSGRKKKKQKFDPYKVDKLGRIPAWIKALFIKWWFAGCVCFFMMMGTGIGRWDALIITGVVLGVIVDILVNPIFRYMESDRKEYDAYIMLPFPFKKYWTFFVNIIYYLVVMFCVNGCYLGLNELCKAVSGTDLAIYVAVEPLLFGVFTLMIDMAFIGIKDGIVYGVKKAKNKKLAEGQTEFDLLQPADDAVKGAEEGKLEEQPVQKSAEASALDMITAEVLSDKKGTEDGGN